MPNPPLIVLHERIGRWHRRLRPVFLSLEPSVRWIESRSGAELEAAVSGSIRPIVLLDVGDRVRSSIEDLDRAVQAAPDALILVLDPKEHPGLAEAAREFGAALVISGEARPPDVTSLLRRWLRSARERDQTLEWSPPVPPEPEAWEDPEAFAKRKLSAARWSGR